MVQDKFYGFQELAEFCEHVITAMFAVAPPTVHVSEQGLATPPHSPNINAKDSPPSLVEFIAYALYRTRLPLAITHQALLLLSRLKARYPSARGTSTSPHRLFLSSLMLSSKISQDDTYSNKSWQVVSQGLFTLREVNQMERELFAFLGWNVVVRDEELTAWVKETVDAYELDQTVPVPVLPSVVASSRPTIEDRKRRRDQSSSRDSWPSSPASASSSRSSSPDDNASRHRRASDAAVALLGVPHAKRRSARTSHRLVSPYSSRPSSTHSQSSSSCSSTFDSPISGTTTPGSPYTPNSDGPLTPDHVDQCLAPAWASAMSSASSRKERPYSPTSIGGTIQVASW